MDRFQQVLLSLIFGLIVIVVISLIQSSNIWGNSGGDSKFRKPTFLILGQNNSGKTALFYRLESESEADESEFVNTVSSIEPNIEEINLPFANASISKKYQLIDYPGHLKYSQLLNKLVLKDITLKNIKGIVYVIDSAAQPIDEYIKQVSRFLFDLLSKTEKKMGGIDILFAVNKQDLFVSRPVFKIKSLIEKEISELIKRELVGHGAHNSGIDKEDDSEYDDKESNYESLRDFWLPVVGKAENPFNFEMLECNAIFIGGSVLKNNIEPWKNWFDEKVVN